MKVKVFLEYQLHKLVDQVNDFCNADNLNILDVQIKPYTDEDKIPAFVATVKYETVEER